MTKAVEIENVSRRFGHLLALDNVSLDVPTGSVFGLIGENGAGKSTLIKHILGLLRAQQGTVRVFGKDPVDDPVGVLAEIGYLAEENDLPFGMRVDELQRYVRSFYPYWDQSYAEELRTKFELPLKARLKNLSKGQRARAGLMVALAYRPKLLLLDEPSSGLDPIVRRDILTTIVRDLRAEGRTVLFSSHLLNEVEEVCDYVAMLRQGHIIFSDKLETLKKQYISVRLKLEAPKNLAEKAIDGIFVTHGEGTNWTILSDRDQEMLREFYWSVGAEVIHQIPAPLDDIFVALSSQNRSSNSK